MCEEADLAENNHYVMGEESFKARYTEWFGGQSAEEETDSETTDNIVEE